MTRFEKFCRTCRVLSLKAWGHSVVSVDVRGEEQVLPVLFSRFDMIQYVEVRDGKRTIPMVLKPHSTFRYTWL